MAAILCPSRIKAPPTPRFRYPGSTARGARTSTGSPPALAFVNRIYPAISPAISATSDSAGIKASLFLNASTRSCSFPSACSAPANAVLTSWYTGAKSVCFYCLISMDSPSRASGAILNGIRPEALFRLRRAGSPDRPETADPCGGNPHRRGRTAGR